MQGFLFGWEYQTMLWQMAGIGGLFWAVVESMGAAEECFSAVSTVVALGGEAAVKKPDLHCSTHCSACHLMLQSEQEVLHYRFYFARFISSSITASTFKLKLST
eukprot:3177693-Amphidinium_carterae.1